MKTLHTPQPNHPHGDNSLPAPIRVFVRLLAGLTALCLLAELVATNLLHLPYPYNWPLMPRQDPFRDFYLYKPRYAYFHSAAFFSFPGPPYLYPASASVVYRFFYLFPHSTAVFLTTLCVTFAVAGVLVGRGLVRRGLPVRIVAPLLITVAACSYPFWFEFEQANIEFTMWVLIVAGLWAFLRNRGYTAAVCFGIAGATKIFPLVFLGLFLARRQYRAFVATIAVTIATTLTSLWLLCPDLAVSWRETQRCVAAFRSIYMLHYEQVGFDHSLFALSKAVLLPIDALTRGGRPGVEAVARMLAIYLPLVAVIGTALYFAKIRRLPVVNQIMCLTIASILLPPVSYDYTLIHLYAPWALLVFAVTEARERLSPGTTGALVCFAIMFAPETELIMHRRSCGGQIKSLTLVVLFLLALRYRFPSSFDEAPVA